jgi:hypothetical protein
VIAVGEVPIPLDFTHGFLEPRHQQKVEQPDLHFPLLNGS